MVRNPDDKELKYFQLFWSGGVDNTRWKKVQSDPMLILVLSGTIANQSDPMLIFLSGIRPLPAYVIDHNSIPRSG